MSSYRHAPEGAFVYRVYDGNDRLLYVGSSGDVMRRWVMHLRQRPRWMPYFYRVRLTGPLTSLAVARAMEREAIRTESPVFNYVHAGGRKSEDRIREYLATARKARAIRKERHSAEAERRMAALRAEWAIADAEARAS